MLFRLSYFTKLLVVFGIFFSSSVVVFGQDSSSCLHFFRTDLFASLSLNPDFIDSKVKDYFHDRTGDFGRGDLAVEHHLPLLLHIAGKSHLVLTESIVRSLKWAANEIVGGGRSNYFMRNRYQKSYAGWVSSALMMLEKLKDLQSYDSRKLEIQEAINYIRNELSYDKVVALRYQQ